MEELQLIRASEEYASQIVEYRQAFLLAGDSMDGCSSLRRIADPLEFIKLCRQMEDPSTVPPDRVPATQLLFVRRSDNRLVGMLDIRHCFNDYPERFGGHIGYSIHPDERRKGYATKMLKAALPLCRALGLKRVLITCLENNIGSEKTILSNGGVYESTVCEPGENVLLKRFWINLEQKELVTIRPTTALEAKELAQIQKDAFLPLYEKYHDEGNPYLRDEEDVLKRLNKYNRYFTILYGDVIVGGIFYRCIGKRNPSAVLQDGEYYLGRVYIHPQYQNKGIAREAILLCEKEFPDAKAFYVDFPEDMEKNKRCYEHAGYYDTGERIRIEGAPTLAVHKKAIQVALAPEEVHFPMIFAVGMDELDACLAVIHKSFQTVAEEFGLTKENCPRHSSFMPLSFLETQMGWGWHMFGLYAGKKIIGYMSLSKEFEGAYELHNLAILPEYRHRGFGTLMLDHAKKVVTELGGSCIKLGMIEESTVLKNWYMSNGFEHIGTKKFNHLPFTSGYLKWMYTDIDKQGEKK